MFELIQRKTDELLGGMCFIEWEAASPQSQPRPYVDDVISYLQVTFMCLTHLPKAAREGIHFASCAHINTAMLDLWLCDARRVKAVNTNGLYNLSVDAGALEAFADSCGVLQLRECFAELRQTLGTLLHRDVHTLLLDAGLREGVFPKVQTGKLVAILEKYKPLGIFAQVGWGGFGWCLTTKPRRKTRRLADRFICNSLLTTSIRPAHNIHPQSNPTGEEPARRRGRGACGPAVPRQEARARVPQGAAAPARVKREEGREEGL